MSFTRIRALKFPAPPPISQSQEALLPDSPPLPTASLDAEGGTTRRGLRDPYDESEAGSRLSRFSLADGEVAYRSGEEILVEDRDGRHSRRFSTRSLEEAGGTIEV